MLQRFRQNIDEVIGKCNATTMEPDLKHCLELLDEVKQASPRLIRNIEAHLVPDPTQIILKSVKPRSSNSPDTGDYIFGDSMTALDNRLGPRDTYGMVLYTVGQAFKNHSYVYNDMVHSIEKGFLDSLRKFIGPDMKELSSHWSDLKERRLTMDALTKKTTEWQSQHLATTGRSENLAEAAAVVDDYYAAVEVLLVLFAGVELSSVGPQRTPSHNGCTDEEDN